MDKIRFTGYYKGAGYMILLIPEINEASNDFEECNVMVYDLNKMFNSILLKVLFKDQIKKML